MNEPVHSTVVPAARGAARTRAAERTTRRKNLADRRAAARTTAGLLDVATTEFAEKGLSGARIDEIAAAPKTRKRMIYSVSKSIRD